MAGFRAGFYVEFHAWTDGGSPTHPSGVVDVTPYVMRATWVEATQPPWGGCTLEMAVPFRLWRTIFPGRVIPTQHVTVSPPRLPGSTTSLQGGSFGQCPETGFWVVLGQVRKSGLRSALGLYRVTHVSSGVVGGADGHVETMPVTVSAEPFIAYLDRSALQMAGGAETGWGEEGFVYDQGSWGSAFQELSSGLLTAPVGVVLERLWREVVRTRLPPSLSGGLLGEQVPVLHTDEQAARLSPVRHGTMGDGVFGAQFNAQFLPGRQSVLQFLTQAFTADPRMVEFFPVVDYLPDKAPPTTEGPSALSWALGGSQPLIVYRMKPWIVRPLTAATVSAETRRSAVDVDVGTRQLEFSERPVPTINYVDKPPGKFTGSFKYQTACEKVGLGQVAQKTKPGVAVDWYEFHRSHVEALTFEWSEADRVNFVFAADYAMDANSIGQGVTGKPLVRDADQVRRHGLRTTSIGWPFFPNESTPGGKSPATLPSLHNATIFDWKDAITEIAWAYAAEGERFCRGSATVVYRPFCKPGHWAEFFFSDSCLTAYVESATHSVGVDQGTGAVISQTVVGYSRGTLRYHDGTFRKPEYQMPAMTAVLNATGKPAQLIFDFLRAVVQVNVQAFQKVKALWTSPSSKGTVAASDLKEFTRYRAAVVEGTRKSLLPNRKTPSPENVVKSGAYTSTKTKKYIVIHYTTTTTLAEMIAAFYEPQKDKKKDEEKASGQTYYYKGTHYSVDKDGTIVEWADPKIYSTYHSRKHSPAVKSEEAIGIDFVLAAGASLTDAQVRAGSALLHKLSAEHGFPLVPVPVAKDRKAEADPLLSDQEMQQYTVFRHGTFASVYTECCGTIDVPALVTFATLVPGLTIKDSADGKAYTIAVVAKAGV